MSFQLNLFFVSEDINRQCFFFIFFSVAYLCFDFHNGYLRFQTLFSELQAASMAQFMSLYSFFIDSILWHSFFSLLTVNLAWPGRFYFQSYYLLYYTIFQELGLWVEELQLIIIFFQMLASDNLFYPFHLAWVDELKSS